MLNTREMSSRSEIDLAKNPIVSRLMAQIFVPSRQTVPHLLGQTIIKVTSRTVDSRRLEPKDPIKTSRPNHGSSLTSQIPSLQCDIQSESLVRYDIESRPQRLLIQKMIPRGYGPDR